MGGLGEGVAQDGVEREGQELPGDDHELVLRDDPPALGRRRHFREVHGHDHRRPADGQAQDGPGQHQQFRRGGEGTGDGGDGEDECQPHDGLAAAETVGQPAGGDGAERRTEEQGRRDQAFGQRCQPEVALHERQGAVDDAGVVAEEQAAERREQRDPPHEALGVRGGAVAGPRCLAAAGVEELVRVLSVFCIGRPLPRLFDVVVHRVQLVAGDLGGVVVLGEDAGDHHGVLPVEEADLLEAAEELVPVDVAVADFQVLVHPDRVAGRVGDVTQPVRGVVVHGVRDVDQAELVPRGPHDLQRRVLHVETVRGDVDQADVLGVQPADHPDRGQALLDEVVRVRVDQQVDAFAFDDRQQFLHGAVERALGFLGLLRAAAEFGVHGADAQVHGDLDGTLPVADGRLAGILIRAGPAQHRQHRGDFDPGVLAGLQLAHQLVVGLRVVVERDEIGVRGHLHVLVAEVRHHPRELEQAVGVVERRGIKGDFHFEHSMVDRSGRAAGRRRFLAVGGAGRQGSSGRGRAWR